MHHHARRLFGVAALFNFTVAAGLLLLRPVLLPLLRLDPVQGSNVAFADLLALMIAVFGYAYWCVANDPVRYRPYIPLSIVGKVAVPLTLAACWLGGHASGRLVALGGSDLVFAALFLAFLRRHPEPARA
ncbi:MAG TPA: hypothetical protein VFA75_12055 [Nevskia sp.]|jgi:hypothetical protein|nr:hypothetical protein [Nevskia sp.]